MAPRRRGHPKTGSRRLEIDLMHQCEDEARSLQKPNWLNPPTEVTTKKEMEGNRRRLKPAGCKKTDLRTSMPSMRLQRRRTGGRGRGWVGMVWRKVTFIKGK